MGDLPGLLVSVSGLVALAGVGLHSLVSLPRKRALAFWLAFAAYASARGTALVIARTPSQHDAGLSPEALALAETVALAIFTYLAWWSACKLARSVARPREARLVVQAVWAGIFLAAARWALGATAAAGGWWIQAPGSTVDVFGPVSASEILEWGFVAVDFLLPFLALTSCAARDRRLRFAIVAMMSLHLAAHFVDSASGATPALLAAVHAGLIVCVAGLALFSTTREEAFAATAMRAEWLAQGALALCGLVLAIVVQALGRPQWPAALLPLALAAIPTARLAPQTLLLVLSAGLVTLDPRFAFATVPALAALLLRWAERGGRDHAVLALLATVVVVAAVPARSVHDEGVLSERLRAAERARLRGEVDTAKRDCEEALAIQPAYAGGPRLPTTIDAALRERRRRPRDGSRVTALGRSGSRRGCTLCRHRRRRAPAGDASKGRCLHVDRLDPAHRDRGRMAGRRAHQG